MTDASPQPDFMIIGAMKCATSTLHEQLVAQPGFFMSTPKEPNFFSDEDQWSKGLGWYRGLFEGAPAGSLRGESSTHYTKLPRHPHVVDRVAQHVPQAKFIYVMRHPIDRLVSHYVHEWTQRVIDDPIGTAIESHPALVDFGHYARQLDPWIERFGKERILPVFFDRLRSNSQAELERVCRFLGYDGTPTWKDDLGAKNVSSERLRASKLRDAIVYAPIVTTIRRRFVPQWVRDQIKSLWTMRNRPTLTDDQMRWLKSRFDPDLARLGGWLGIDLCCDNFVDQTENRALNWVEPLAATS